MNIVRSKLELSALFLSASLLFAGTARAGDKALAESLFDAGRQLMQAGDYQQACPKFAESQRQDPSPGTLINLAKCYEGLGRTASAWAEYKEAATLARTMGRDSQATFADEGVRRLEPTLSRLRIDGPKTPVPGLMVLRDGAELGLGSLGIALALDPGEHVIEARAPGYKPFTAHVAVKGQGDQQVLALPELEREPVAPLPTNNAAPVAAATQNAGPTPDEVTGPKSSGSNRTLAFVFGGVGVAGLAVGTTFALMAKSQADKAEEDPALCPAKVCTPEGRQEINAAETKAMIANVGFGVGLAGIGVGVYFLLSGGKAEAPPAAARLRPWVGAGTTGVSYAGAF